MEVIFRGDQTNHNCLLTFSPFLWKERKENSDQYPSCVSAIIINFTEFSFLVHLQSFEAGSFKGFTVSHITEQFQVLWEILSNQDESYQLVTTNSERKKKREKQTKKAGKENIYGSSFMHFLVAQSVKNLPCNVGDPGSIPGLGRSPGGENSNPLQ